MTPSVNLTFLGAAGTVTGSKYLLTVDGRRILVDCGMFQGDKQWRLQNWADFPIDPATIDLVLLTHAHADHCSYLPALVKGGFRGDILATEGTIELAAIVLRDAGKLQELETEQAIAGGYSKHATPRPLYTGEDVERTLPLFRPVGFDTDIDLGQGVSARWVRAGHILGSASVRVQTPSTSVLFSGDLGRHNHPILKPRATPPGADFVLIESTYGDREHAEPEVAHQDFADAINRTVKRGGKVLVPAFAIDRTETILMALSEMLESGRIGPVPIYVDGPMATAALAVYRDESLDEIKDGVHVHDFAALPGLREARTSDDSRKINEVGGPAVIISSSGMLEGGRVLHHLSRLLPDRRNTIVLTGYQAEGTRGRDLEDGARQVKVRGRYVKVAAEIVRDREFSVHGDRSDLLDWLRDLDPQPNAVFVVHGEPAVAGVFADTIASDFGLVAVVPRYGEVVRLDPDDPDEPDILTEGVVIEGSGGVEGD